MAVNYIRIKNIELKKPYFAKQNCFQNKKSTIDCKNFTRDKFFIFREINIYRLNSQYLLSRDLDGSQTKMASISEVETEAEVTSGAGGGRTLVQTWNQYAFYMLSSHLVLVHRQANCYQSMPYPLRASELSRGFQTPISDLRAPPFRLASEKSGNRAMSCRRNCCID